MDWLTNLVSGLGNLAGQAVPYVGEYLTNQQQLELAQYQLQQQQLQAQAIAEQQRIAAEKQKTMMYVVGGVAAAGIVAVMLFRR